jgi:hypothetical protein
MPKKPTLFMVTDIETTVRHRIAFDIAWRTIDRKGKVYAEGSYIVREAFRLDVPFFKEKLGYYFDDTFAHRIVPAGINEIKDEYNLQIRNFHKSGHRVIPCAYNAAFDFKYMPETLQKLNNDSSARWLTEKVELMDIWDFWGRSVPKNYKALPSNSGKYYSTSAESAYRFEFDHEEFEERHIAWHDCIIEGDILQKALARKKALTTVKNPKELVGGIWKTINTRLGVTGKEMLAA